MRVRSLVFVFLVALVLVPTRSPAWDFSNAGIDPSEILSGGPPRDGIPALTNPAYVDKADATFLKGDDRVLGVRLNGDARAYPLKILSWHELVNDSIGGTPVLVSW